jgi:LmbE family N-acetylglucosaminyl deacetylase
MTVPGPMLSVWAHPDDETYLAGATMAQAVRDGRRVVCVTATRGELGSTDPERWPPATRWPRFVQRSWSRRSPNSA